MSTYQGYMATYYEGIVTDAEKYHIPQAFVLDYNLDKSTNSIMIYGLMSDNDPRVTSNNANAKTMLVRISNVMNPN